VVGAIALQNCFAEPRRSSLRAKQILLDSRRLMLVNRFMSLPVGDRFVRLEALTD
jgi:hypothetical protein